MCIRDSFFDKSNTDDIVGRQCVKKLAEGHRPRGSSLVVRTARQTSDYVTNSSGVVGVKLYVQGVARFSVSATEVGVPYSIRSLDMDDKPVNVQDDLVVDTGLIIRA